MCVSKRVVFDLLEGFLDLGIAGTDLRLQMIHRQFVYLCNPYKQSP